MKRESHCDKHFTCIHTSPKSLFQMNNGASEMFQNLTNFTQLTNPPTPTSPPAPPLTGKGRRGGQPGRRGRGEGGLGAPGGSGRRGRAGGNTRSGPLNVAPAPANSFRLDGLFRTGDTGLPHS